MLFGGSRSGKTALHVYNTILRAAKAPESRHGICRFRLNSVRASVMADTFPKVAKLAFPAMAYDLRKNDGVVTLPNKSEIWFFGLDDKERTEKILGMEFATLYANECSQIPFGSVEILETRLAQKCMQKVQGQPDKPLKLRMFYDCNPPNKSHWTYKRFILKQDPNSGMALPNADQYGSFKINPRDNAENLADGYIEKLEGQSARQRKRFLDGEFADANPYALFPDENIDKWRHDDGMPLPQFVRVVVSVDPSGADDVDNADNDEIGLCVVGLGVDGNAYLIEDLTLKAGPATWGRVATDAFDRHKADVIVAETNFGGAMVRQIIQTVRPRTNFKAVTASRGKTQRAEPFAALYEQGKVRHVGRFPKLEDELSAFSTSGYTGAKSPNRADALIWSLAELFPAIVGHGAKPALPPRKPSAIIQHSTGWMS